VKDRDTNGMDRSGRSTIEKSASSTPLLARPTPTRRKQRARLHPFGLPAAPTGLELHCFSFDEIVHATKPFARTEEILNSGRLALARRGRPSAAGRSNN
jgi:hypothetical protein